MIAARIGLGVGEGATPPALYSMTARWIPARERSRVITFDLTGVYLGLTIAFPIAMWLMTNWGWPWAFYSFGLLGIVWSVLWYFLVPSRPETTPASLLPS